MKRKIVLCTLCNENNKSDVENDLVGLQTQKKREKYEVGKEAICDMSRYFSSQIKTNLRSARK